MVRARTIKRLKSPLSAESSRDGMGEINNSSRLESTAFLSVKTKQTHGLIIQAVNLSLVAIQIAMPCHGQVKLLEVFDF